jgi:hypothetical protein
MAARSFLPVEKNAIAANSILLTEHGKEQSILFFVITSADSFGYVGK